MTKPLKELIDDAKAAIVALEESEAGRLPYCEDQDDGCSEAWQETVADFAKAAVALLSWPTGKWDAEATARTIERHGRDAAALDLNVGDCPRDDSSKRVKYSLIGGGLIRPRETIR